VTRYLHESKYIEIHGPRRCERASARLRQTPSDRKHSHSFEASFWPSSCCAAAALGAKIIGLSLREFAPRVDASIRVLMIEDDSKLAQLTAKYLEIHGIDVVCALDGESGIGEFIRGAFDVVLLDLMLPGINGMDVCRELRARSDIPVLMLTARGEEAERVQGLEAGADDYIAKPFSSRELLARIRAQVRRARRLIGPPSKFLSVGPLRLELGAMSVAVDGKEISVTSYEFALLRVLVERAGHVFTREQLLDLARGSADDAFDRSIDVHIFRLRQKLEVDPRRPRLLKTVRGLGYMVAHGVRGQKD
jgi:two-component system, OmpR family, response regulator